MGEVRGREDALGGRVIILAVTVKPWLQAACCVLQDTPAPNTSGSGRESNPVNRALTIPILFQDGCCIDATDGLARVRYQSGRTTETMDPCT
jgi:hypothetical protein